MQSGMGNRGFTQLSERSLPARHLSYWLAVALLAWQFLQPAVAGQDIGLSGTVQIPAGTQWKVRLEDKLSTGINAKGDTFYVELLEDALLPGGYLVPRNTQLMGRIKHMKRAGRISRRAEMQFGFELLKFRSGTRIPIEATLFSIPPAPQRNMSRAGGSIQAEGDTHRSLGTIGAATGIGALIGSIKGGGAAIGAGAGAAVGLAGVLASKGRDLELSAETHMIVRFEKPVELPAELLKTLP
jgi:hypothetical protein